MKVVRSPHEPWVSTREIAEHVGVTEQTIHALILDGMPHVTLRARKRFRKSEVDAWLRDKGGAA